MSIHPCPSPLTRWVYTAKIAAKKFFLFLVFCNLTPWTDIIQIFWPAHEFAAVQLRLFVIVNAKLNVQKMIESSCKHMFSFRILMNINENLFCLLMHYKWDRKVFWWYCNTATINDDEEAGTKGENYHYFTYLLTNPQWALANGYNGYILRSI